MEQAHLIQCVVRWLAPATLLTVTACVSAPAPSKTTVPTTVIGREMSFTPAVVTATTGRPVTITFANEGAIEHDWAILRLAARDIQATTDGSGGTHQAQTGDGSTPAVHVAALPGQRATVTFTPEAPGRYTIVCTVPGHKEAGMMGMLTVVD